MTTLLKSEMVKDPVFKKVFDLIVKNHKPAPHTKKVLKANKHIKDFCETAEHFSEIKNQRSLYLSYITNSWIQKNEVLVRIASVTIYDDWNEFQKHRLKALHSGAANHNVENN
jgi:hypothetical protein